MEELVIPDNMPQPNEVYKEQINILKPILQSERCSNLQNISKVECISTNSAAPTASTSMIASTSRTVFNSDNPAKPGTMQDKLEKNSPYNLFFTSIPKSPETSKEINSVTFTG